VSLSTPFIQRPVATTLLTAGIALSGVVAFFLLPVAPLPQVDFPTISVQASLPGASPETMASTVATPLERALGVIAGVTEITSQSTLGNTRITLQFDLNRDIDGAARDVQAAINAARDLLPTGLPSNPTYRKVNPADAPIMILALTSDTMTQGQMYDAASTILAQKLSQVDGIGQVSVGGSSLPAVRVELNVDALNNYGIGLDDVRNAIAATNANRPKGVLEDGDRQWQILANDQATKATDYIPLIVAWRNGAAVRLSDIADVSDSVQDLRNAGSSNGRPSVAVILNRQPGANIIETADRVRALLPVLRASIPGAINLDVVVERTSTIRASLREVERTLIISVTLVILVVFAFLRNVRATLIPTVAVPVSLIATFGAMYLCNFSLNNISLMALTIATGFVVDDAIVVLENITRHIEEGMTPFQAALRGAREVGFTVVSMSLSLIAVFIPILLMGGIVGRLFREFAVTLSVAILISLLVSLTATPMMCARVLRRPAADQQHGRLYRASEYIFDSARRSYERSLGWALRHPLLMIMTLFATIALNFFLYIVVPKGFFPQQDTGRLIGSIQADQAISFQAMRGKLSDFMKIIGADPAVTNVIGYTGGGQRNSGFMFISLKDLGERKESVDQVMARMRAQLAKEPGAQLYLQAVQDIRVGGRSSNALYQYTLQADDLDQLREWTPRLEQALHQVPDLVDVSTDQQAKGLQTSLVIDRATASRLGVTPLSIDGVLNNAFGQALVSTIYAPLNQYRVVMEAAQAYWEGPDGLNDIYVHVTASSTLQPGPGTGLNSGAGGSTSASAGGSASSAASSGSGGGAASAGTVPNNTAPGATLPTNAFTSGGVIQAGQTKGSFVPLAAFAHYDLTNTSLAVNHQGQFVASTISFNLPPGKSLSDAVHAIEDTMVRIGAPATLHGSFQGTARAFQDSLSSQPWLILAALVTVYIVLGVLYESFVHPITILSTLPSAGVGALLALLLFNLEFSIISLIGVVLLIGIVKKNAIMMVDLALDIERSQGKSPREAIYEASLVRFRPILMTTMAAMLGAVPLAVGTGYGAEMRHPLGVTIVGGLIVSQLLTLYTTPILYLYLDSFRLWCDARFSRRGSRLPRPHPSSAP
jgi:multidrug efflux pump